MENKCVYGDERATQGTLFDGLNDIEMQEMCPYLIREKASLPRVLRRRVVSRINGPDYEGFLKEHRAREVPEGLDQWADTKKRILKIFSHRFREGGSQDLETRDYAPAEVGAMYRCILRQALKEESKSLVGSAAIIFIKPC